MGTVIVQTFPEQYLNTYEDAVRNQHQQTKQSPFALLLVQLIIVWPPRCWTRTVIVICNRINRFM